MEQIDALEAVRRLTLERDALAEQVRRLKEQAATRIRERDDAVQRANHAENAAARLEVDRDRWKAAFNQSCAGTCVAPTQAADRIEKKPQTCEGCKYADKTDPSNEWVYCKRHAPIVYLPAGGGTTHTGWPHVYHHNRCGDWEAK